MKYSLRSLIVLSLLSATCTAAEKETVLEGEWERFSANYGVSGREYYTFRGNRLTLERWSSTSIDKRTDVPLVRSVSEWTIEIDETQKPSRLIMKLIVLPGEKPAVSKMAFAFKEGRLWLVEDRGKPITFDPAKISGQLTGFKRRSRPAKQEFRNE